MFIQIPINQLHMYSDPSLNGTPDTNLSSNHFNAPSHETWQKYLAEGASQFKGGNYIYSSSSMLRPYILKPPPL